VSAGNLPADSSNLGDVVFCFAGGKICILWRSANSDRENGRESFANQCIHLAHWRI